jgi:hypothetical protein
MSGEMVETPERYPTEAQLSRYIDAMATQHCPKCDCREWKGIGVPKCECGLTWVCDPPAALKP